MVQRCSSYTALQRRSNSGGSSFPQRLTVLIILISSLSGLAQAAIPFNYRGCYSASDIGSSISELGSYQYQSVDHCQQSCGDAEVAALLGGSTCYCGQSTSFLASLTALPESSCNIECSGWPYQICGGDSAMNVYINANAVVPSAVSATHEVSSTSELESSSQSTTSSSSSSSTRTSTHSTTSSASSTDSSTDSSSSSASAMSSTSSTQSTTSIATSSSDSESSEIQSSTSSKTTLHTKEITSTRISIQYTTNIITQSVIQTSNGPVSTILITETSVISTATSSATGAINLNANKSTDGHGHKLSGGAIAGIVIGVVFGTFFLAALAIFFFWRRKQNKGDEEGDLDLTENKQYQPYSYGEDEVIPVVVPPTNTIKRDTTRYSVASKPWGFVSRSPKPSESSRSSRSHNGSGNLLNEEPKSKSIIDENKIHTNDANTGSQQAPDIHENIFEDPVTIYASENIFSATSLQDIGNDSRLRIVNPDEMHDADESSSGNHDSSSIDIQEK